MSNTLFVLLTTAKQLGVAAYSNLAPKVGKVLGITLTAIALTIGSVFIMVSVMAAGLVGASVVTAAGQLTASFVTTVFVCTVGGVFTIGLLLVALAVFAGGGVLGAMGWASYTPLLIATAGILWSAATWIAALATLPELAVVGAQRRDTFWRRVGYLVATEGAVTVILCVFNTQAHPTVTAVTLAAVSGLIGYSVWRNAAESTWMPIAKTICVLAVVGALGYFMWVTAVGVFNATLSKVAEQLPGTAKVITADVQKKDDWATRLYLWFKAKAKDQLNGQPATPTPPRPTPATPATPPVVTTTPALPTNPVAADGSVATLVLDACSDGEYRKELQDIYQHNFLPGTRNTVKVKLVIRSASTCRTGTLVRPPGAQHFALVGPSVPTMVTLVYGDSPRIEDPEQEDAPGQSNINPRPRPAAPMHTGYRFRPVHAGDEPVYLLVL